jgi:hypothetical protein
MTKQMKILTCLLAVFILSLSLVSAMNVQSVSADNFQPGSEQGATVKIKNSLGDDAKDVSLSLDTTGLPFSVVKADNSIDEINSDDSDTVKFTLKASNDAKAGDYQIPYTLYYTINTTRYPIPSPTTGIIPKTGTITLTIEADSELSYSISAESPVIGSKGKITLNIVNKGLGDAKFVSVKILPEGYTLLSDGESYIGTISSDDSQTASFDVIFKTNSPTLSAQISYKDFNNKDVIKSVSLPVTVYSQEQALKLGLIQPNSTPTYITIAIVFLAGWMIIRRIRKKRRMNKAQGR